MIVENPPGPYRDDYASWPTARPPAGWDIGWTTDGIHRERVPYPRAWLWVQPALDATNSTCDGLWSVCKIPVLIDWRRRRPSIVDAAREARQMADELEAERDAYLDALEREPWRMTLPIEERFEGVLDAR